MSLIQAARDDVENGWSGDQQNDERRGDESDQ
jgi:hypothetical protein